MASDDNNSSADADWAQALVLMPVPLLMATLLPDAAPLVA